MTTFVPDVDVVELVALRAFVWVREMEELRVDTGFKIRVGGLPIGPSGARWEAINESDRLAACRLVADELAGREVAEAVPARVFQAFVYAVATVYCADRDALKRIGRDWLRRHPL